MPTASLQKGKSPQQVSWIQHKTASDGWASVLMLGEIWSTPSMPLFPGPLGTGVVVHTRVPSMGQIELFNHLTVRKQMAEFKLN